MSDLKLPWRLGERSSYTVGGDYFDILDSDGALIAAGISSDLAAMILREVNGHTALVEGVEQMMTLLDKISTIAEGTPQRNLLEIHRLAGDAMYRGNVLLDLMRGDQP